MYFVTAVFAALIGRELAIESAVANVIATALYVAVTFLVYELFKPVSKNLSVVAALLSLIGCAITTLSLFHRTSLNINAFFGPYCMKIGYLIYRSTFLPQFLGVLMALAGLGWLIFPAPFVASYL